MSDTQTTQTMHEKFHMVRSWSGSRLEDACLCPQEPCQLVQVDKALPDCPEHGFGKAKTMRQVHFAADCTAFMDA